jgi:hypothetical protein
MTNGEWQDESHVADVAVSGHTFERPTLGWPDITHSPCPMGTIAGMLGVKAGDLPQA